jgi:hypothetical protein
MGHAALDAPSASLALAPMGAPRTGIDASVALRGWPRAAS